MPRKKQPPEQDALLPIEPEQRVPTANDLTMAWCQGYSEVRLRQPHPNTAKRVGRVAKNVGADCETREHWRDAWRAAYQAGRQGRWDFAALLIDEQPRSLHQVHTSAREITERGLRQGAITSAADVVPGVRASGSEPGA